MGAWEYHKTNRTLDLTCCPHYQVDLDRCNTSAEVLDWIIQVSKKTWATREVIADLVLMLDRCLDLQANICSMGVDHPFDVKKWLNTKKAYLHYHLSSKEFEDFLREYLKEDGNEVVPIDFGKIEAAEKEYLSRITGDKKRAAH
jgi:hypothetical protein